MTGPDGSNLNFPYLRPTIVYIVFFNSILSCHSIDLISLLLLELQRVLLSFLPHELCKKGQNTCRSLLT